MRVSLEWLRAFVGPEGARRAAAEAAETLTMAGLAVESVTELGSGAGADAILELDVTTNRPDALGHYGVAREWAAAAGMALRGLAESQPALVEEGAAAEALRVEIEAPEECARYCARVVDGIMVGPAPENVRERLEKLGQRAINNAADLTNYTMWELGHATHAFDAATLEGGAIRVRRARAGERLVTLDGVDRPLSPEDLVIADARRPVALAGVMGGLATAVGPETRRVVIESAWFEPVRIRQMAQRHGLHTEASHRFERGADPEICGRVADRVAGRLQAAGGGVVLGGLIDIYPRPWRAGRIVLRGAAVRRLLGAEIGGEEARRILAALGIRTEAGDAAGQPRGGEGERRGGEGERRGGGEWVLTATPPPWRPDLREEADLIEEIARIHGYGRFAARLPAFAGAAQAAPAEAMEEGARARLRGLGYAEAVALSFAAEEECRIFAPRARAVRIERPISEEAAILRTSALPAMVHLLAYNLNRGQGGPRLFEMGKVYAARAEARGHRAEAEAREPGDWVEERRVLALGAAGRAEPVGWAQNPRAFDFFDLKAAVEAVMGGFEVTAETRRLEDPAFHPGRAAAVWHNGRAVARYGQLHPARAAEWKLKAEIYLAEVDLEALYALGAKPARYAPPLRFPASERDFSFFFADAVEWARIEAAVRALELPALAEVQPVEVFRGGAVAAGEYSLLLRARFQLAERTLREEEIAAQAGRMVAALKALGGRQR